MLPIGAGLRRTAAQERISCPTHSSRSGRRTRQDASAAEAQGGGSLTGPRENRGRNGTMREGEATLSARLDRGEHGLPQLDRIQVGWPASRSEKLWAIQPCGNGGPK